MRWPSGERKVKMGLEKKTFRSYFLLLYKSKAGGVQSTVLRVTAHVHTRGSGRFIELYTLLIDIVFTVYE